MKRIRLLIRAEQIQKVCGLFQTLMQRIIYGTRVCFAHYSSPIFCTASNSPIIFFRLTVPPRSRR